MRGGGEVGVLFPLQAAGSLWIMGLEWGSLLRRLANLLVMSSAWNLMGGGDRGFDF